ncbi:hypothetical protein NE237_012509 [Protea cynaroides]|uniref:DUF7610 domain-containing protein n=1 Tax=Protea cynaroides TaxID=273540 RepID=A0A9Q0JXP2_9MAGN|nr:hypothetical protein NE237_012509 [Protea cynaroides]
MAKRSYALLQNKLKELESELNQVMNHQLLSESINGKFTFLKSLLSAEFQSHPQNTHHLRHISERLEELESAFKDWDTFGTSSVDHIDTASTCSCTDSCFNDDEIQDQLQDGDGGGSPPDLDPEIDFEGVIQEQEQEQQPMATVKQAEGCGEREERRLRNGNKVSSVMSGVVMLTAVALLGVVMASFSGSFCYKTGLEGFLTPT